MLMTSYLMSSFNLLQNLVVADLFHVVELLDLTRMQQKDWMRHQQTWLCSSCPDSGSNQVQVTWTLLQVLTNLRRPLKGLYLVAGFDANKCLSEGHRPEATVKEEKAYVGVDV